jgi:omega-amidase
MASGQLHIVLVQPDLYWLDIPKNLSKIASLLEGLSGKPDLVVLPEMFSTGFCTDPAPVAETMEGGTISWMKKTAGSLKTAIAGSMIIREQDQYFNRLICVDPHHLEWYDKRHLFTVDGEESAYTRGTRPLIVKVGPWRVNFQICYDLRFPVWSRNRQNYDLLIYSASWPEVRSDVWNTLLRARAIENQCYVAGVNRVGIDGNNISYIGESIIIDPKGNEIAALPPSSEGLISTAISLDKLKIFRTKFPVWKDSDDFSFNQ